MAVLSQKSWLGSRLDKAWFDFRAYGLRFARAMRNLQEGGVLPAFVHTKEYAETSADQPLILGESVTPLWAARSNDNTHLVAGKVQNLRVAAAKINGLRIAGGDVFSFWKAVGRPTKAQGYVQGRELREGCMIASVGGGLCQLSNALYSAALNAGCEIVERHAHSQVVPGSLAELGRDATVFWNYVDLRFRPERTIVIDICLTKNDLVVRFRAQADSKPKVRAVSPRAKTSFPIMLKAEREPDDCAQCVQLECVQHIDASSRTKSTAYLLDESWPEFDQWLSTQIQAGDVALVPVDGTRRNRANYNWSTLRNQNVRIIENRMLTMRRSLVSRSLKNQGAERQQALLKLDSAFARSYASQIPYGIENLVVPINMLATLWQMGVLGGRHVTVLMTRSPLAMLQTDLDRAAALHPESTTLADFRADAELTTLEEMALHAAHRLLTPHSAVAAYASSHYPAEVVQVDWLMPKVAPQANRGKRILFPASALGRKGAFAVRSACKALGLPLDVLGSASESADFWHGLSINQANPAQLFENVGCVVLPAFIEQRPKLLLKALALGIPVICSPECGLPPNTPGATIIPADDYLAFTAALQSAGIEPSSSLRSLLAA